MKECSRCNKIKDIVMFHEHKNTKDKLHIHCKECVSEYNKDYRIKNKEKLSQISKNNYINNSDMIKKKTNEHYHNNKESIKISRKKYREDNADKLKEVNRNYRLENQDKIVSYRRLNSDKIKQTTRIYHKNNAGLVNSITARRRASKLLATPKWLTDDHLKEIKQFYIQAKELEKLDGIKRHVDHIIPLQGETVCGLHVPWNLQILTAEENVRKKNKLLI